MRTTISTIIAIGIAIGLIGNVNAESYQSCIVYGTANSSRLFVYTWNAAEYGYVKTTVTVNPADVEAAVESRNCNDSSIQTYAGQVIPMTVEDQEIPNSWSLTNYQFTSGTADGMPVSGAVIIGGKLHTVRFFAEHEDMVYDGDTVIIIGTNTVVWYSGQYERMMVSDAVLTPVTTPSYTVALPLVTN